MPSKSKPRSEQSNERKPKYQLLNRLNEEEYAALEADIRKRGVLIPVERDENGDILDGHNRHEIATRLGVPCPEIVRRFSSEQEKRDHVIKMNIARRHLDPIRWGQAFKMLLEENGGGGGPGRPKAGNNSATVAELAEELGVPVRTAEHRLGQAKAYESLPDPVREKVDHKEITLPQAKRQVDREEKREALREMAGRWADIPAAWSIERADSVAWMQIIKPGSVRLIFADPPYNIGIDYGDGSKEDKLDDAVYLDWCAVWIGQCVDLLAPDGSMWVLIGDEYAAEYALILKRTGLHRRSWIIWYETFGVCSSAATNFSRTHRHLFYCVKDPKRFVFHPDAVSRPSDRQTKYNDTRANPGGKVWDDVWQISRLVGTATERIPDFPTQLPLALLSPIVECSSDPGDLVLDPFSGSASTGAAAIRAGRRYIGIEKQKRFATLSRLRLQGEPNGTQH